MGCENLLTENKTSRETIYTCKINWKIVMQQEISLTIAVGYAPQCVPSNNRKPTKYEMLSCRLMFSEFWSSGSRNCPEEVSHLTDQGFWQFCKVAEIFVKVKVPDVTYFWRKSKIFNQNGQIVGNGGGAMVTTEVLVVYHCECIFYRISKKKYGNWVIIVSLITIQMVDRPNTTPIGQDNLR